MQRAEPILPPADATAASADPPTSEPASAMARSGSLGRAVGHGFSWLSFSLFAGRAFGVVAQLILGRLLSDEDFGEFAIVVSVASLVRVFLDGGVPQVLIQRGDSEFRRLAGPGFWLSALFGFTAGCGLAAASPLLARFYDDPHLTPLLLIVAASLPLGAPSAMMRAALRVDLRFKALALIALGWFAVRHFGSVGLALVGFGAMSLVLPLLFNVLFEWAAAYWATRMKPWRAPLGIAEWPGLLRDSVWVVTAACCRGLTRTGDYLVLGAMTPKSVVGKYYFGYLITTQIVEMLAANLQQVMFPVMSRLTAEPQRQSRAILRTTRMLVLVAAPVSLALAIGIEPMITFLDSWLWKGKWSAAIPLMQILAVAAPVRMFSDVVNAALASRGRFRASAGLTLVEGLWLMASAFLSVVLFGENLAGIAAVIAISQVLFSILANMLMLRGFGIAGKEFLAAVLPAWLIAVGSAAVATLASAAAGLTRESLTSLAISAPVFVVAFAALARRVLRTDLEDLIRVMPAALGGLTRRALMLSDAGPA